MARAASAPKKEVSMEEALWKSADTLSGSVEPAEYKPVVLSLFFLKFARDKFEAQRKAIAEKYGEKFVDNVAFYTKDNVMCVCGKVSKGCVVTRKPILPSEEELEYNSRSKSAKLRIFERR